MGGWVGGNADITIISEAKTSGPMIRVRAQEALLRQDPLRDPRRTFMSPAIFFGLEGYPEVRVLCARNECLS